MKHIEYYKDLVIDYVRMNKKLLIRCGACFVVGCVIGYSSVV